MISTYRCVSVPILHDLELARQPQLCSSYAPTQDIHTAAIIELGQIWRSWCHSFHTEYAKGYMS